MKDTKKKDSPKKYVYIVDSVYVNQLGAIASIYENEG